MLELELLAAAANRGAEVVVKVRIALGRVKGRMAEIVFLRRDIVAVGVGIEMMVQGERWGKARFSRGYISAAIPSNAKKRRGEWVKKLKKAEKEKKDR